MTAGLASGKEYRVRNPHLLCRGGVVVLFNFRRENREGGGFSSSSKVELNCILDVNTTMWKSEGLGSHMHNCRIFFPKVSPEMQSKECFKVYISITLTPQIYFSKSFPSLIPIVQH